MKNKNFALIMIMMIVFVILAVGGIVYFMKTSSVPKNNVIEKTTITSNDLTNNICEADNDCEYIWFTGACNTPEYVAKIQKEAEEQGIRIGEARLRENVTCTCENNKCVTHN